MLTSFVFRGDAQCSLFRCAPQVEASVGSFLQQHLQEGGLRKDILIHTKFVPDLDCLQALDEDHVRAVVTRSCNRLGVDNLDLVQFHWCVWPPA